jgi:hypothetical protein
MIQPNSVNYAVNCLQAVLPTENLVALRGTGSAKIIRYADQPKVCAANLMGQAAPSVGHAELPAVHAEDFLVARIYKRLDIHGKR